MKRLSTKQVEVGMILDEDVKGSQGQILLSEGVEITEKQIRTLKMWGISNIAIQSSEPDEKKPLVISTELRKAAEAAMLPVFQHTDLEHPFIAELFKFSVVRKALLPPGKAPHEQQS